ncbi:MAG: DNA/RNA endonuclease G [bacterium]|nr:DNA/RNA endonuclease G [bacterium]
MFELPSLRRETRYGVPAADQVLFNRFYSLGYSYHFRQAKWALEIVDTDKTDVEREDPFRSDYRIPEMFRADKADYRGSGYDRGHLVASDNQIETGIQNSETFLLSNISPQVPAFNQRIWLRLERAVRALAGDDKIMETYVICGPIFDFSKPVKSIGSTDNNGVTLPIPHWFFKSILTENNRGTLKMWSFLMPHKNSSKPLKEFLVPTSAVERYSGLILWERLTGTKIKREKNRVRSIWNH